MYELYYRKKEHLNPFSTVWVKLNKFACFHSHKQTNVALTDLPGTVGYIETINIKM